MRVTTALKKLYLLKTEIGTVLDPLTHFKLVIQSFRFSWNSTMWLFRNRIAWQHLAKYFCLPLTPFPIILNISAKGLSLLVYSLTLQGVSDRCEEHTDSQEGFRHSSSLYHYTRIYWSLEMLPKCNDLIEAHPSLENTSVLKRLRRLRFSPVRKVGEFNR